MAKNVVFYGDQMTVPVLAGTVSGDPVIIGLYTPGVALTDRDAAGNATVKFSGVVDLTFTAAGALSVGDPIWIASADYALTDSAGAGTYTWGVLMEAVAGAGAVTAKVRIGTPGQGL